MITLPSCFPGIFAFFFFSGRVKAFENTAPNLHYYWVPILVSSIAMLRVWWVMYKDM